MQVCCSFLVFFFYFSKKAPLCLKNANQRIKELDELEKLELEENPNGIMSENKIQKIKNSKLLVLGRFIRDTLIKIKFISFDPFIIYNFFFVKYYYNDYFV